MISIVIPTLNEGRRINTLLGQLIELEGIKEIIVVDASDPLMTIDHDSPMITRLPAKKRGRATQMNQGATHCSQDAIIFLHSDTNLPNNASHLVTAALQSYKWGRFKLRLDASGFAFRVIEMMINLRSRVTNLATGDQAIFVNRQWFQSQGRYAELALMEDIEFSKRVGKQFPPALVKTKITTSARRWINHGILRTILTMWKIRFLYWRGVAPEKLAALYRDAR